MKKPLLIFLFVLCIILKVQGQTVVSTISQLQATTATATSAAIVTDPIRGGDFVGKSITGYTIDSGTVFPSAASGFVWVRMMTESAAINVQWFGVNGDSSTNCVVLMNKILSLFKGRKIYCPKGKYGVNGASIAIPSNTEIYGDGRDTTIFLGLNGNKFPIFENLPDSGAFGTANKFASENVTVHDLTVDGSQNSGDSTNYLQKGHCGFFCGVTGLHIYNTTWQHGASNCLRITFSRNFVIEYCSFLYANDGGRPWVGEGNGLALLADGNSAVLKDDLTGLVDHCYAAFNADVGLDSWGMHNVVFSNNKTEANSKVRSAGAGIALEGGAFGCKIVNNIAVNENKNGFGITRSSNTEFIDNLAYNVKNVGLVGSITLNTKIDHFISLYSGASGISFTEGSGQVNASLKITNCKIDYAGFNLDSTTGNKVSTTTSGDGIYVGNGYGALLDNNEVTNCRQSGIQLKKVMKTPIAAATTGNITLSGLQTVDAVTLTANKIVLVKNQTDTTQNGLYIVSAGNWLRADDSLAGYMLGTIIPIGAGSINGGTYWRFADDDAVFGKTKIRYVQTKDTLIRGIITNSRVNFNGEWGIRLESVSGIKIVRNEVNSNGQIMSGRTGIYTNAGLYNSVESNNLSDNQATPTQLRGYNEVGVSGNNFYYNNDVSGNINVSSPAQGISFDPSGKQIFDATNTPSGTLGNQTINKPSGTVNIQSGTTKVTVTNSLVTSSSIVFAVIRTNDPTNAVAIKSVVPANGAFDINLTIAPSLNVNVSVGFLVIN